MDAAPSFVRAPAETFAGAPNERPHEAFDVLATDADLDGDPDVLINWHHRGPIEIFENRDGRMQLVNAPGADRTALVVNLGVPDIYADSKAISQRIANVGQAGIYLWHDSDRDGSWRIETSKLTRSITIRIEVVPKILEVEVSEGVEVDRSDERNIRVSIAAASPASIRVRGLLEGRFTIHSRLDDDSAPDLWVGPEFHRIVGGDLELWKDDPHGMAWVDVVGTPHPELFVTRGGLMGTLKPPQPPKTDRFYEGRADFAFVRTSPNVIPAGYGRGRRVEWVDLDGDGWTELAIANKSTANQILKRDERGVFRDRAPLLGLAYVDGEVNAFSDFDGDGRQDLFTVNRRSIDVARNVPNGHFRVVHGRSIGLGLPRFPSREGFARAFERKLTALRFADFDSDGDLDLGVFALGPNGSHRLFRRDGRRYTDVTTQSGIAHLRGGRGAVIADFDGDGYEDVVTFGVATALWIGCGDLRFAVRELGSDLVPESINAGTALDADGDGRTDLLLVGRRRHLLMNTTVSTGASLDVSIQSLAASPIGALVRAFYSDGRIVAKRYGSARSSGYSQVLGPLRFGNAGVSRIESVAVRWPGETIEERFDVTAGARKLLLVMGGDSPGG